MDKLEIKDWRRKLPRFLFVTVVEDEEAGIMHGHAWRSYHGERDLQPALCGLDGFLSQLVDKNNTRG